MPNTKAGNLAFSPSSAEQRKDGERNYPLIFPCRCLACTGQKREREGGGADLFGEAIFFLHHQMAGLRTLFNPIKDDEQFKHARGVEDEVLQGHHRWSPLSLLNC